MNTARKQLHPCLSPKL